MLPPPGPPYLREGTEGTILSWFLRTDIRNHPFFFFSLFPPLRSFLLSSFFSLHIGLGWNQDETHRAGSMNLGRFQLPVSGRNRVGRVTQTDEPLTPLAWVYSNPRSPGHWPYVFIPLALPSPSQNILSFSSLPFLLSPPGKHSFPSDPPC